MSELLDRSAPLLRRHHSLNQAESKLCLICSERFRADKYFSACAHKGSCVKCAESQMINSIELRRYPKCLLDPDCQAKMLTSGEICIYRYFTQEGKAKWQKFQSECDEVQHHPNPLKQFCKKQGCSGIIANFRCLKCKTYYCQICLEISHTLQVACRKPNPIKIEGLKQCPNCRTNYVRDEGCHHVKCPNCHHEFCEVCQHKWGLNHHTCKYLKEQKNGQNRLAESCAIF